MRFEGVEQQLRADEVDLEHSVSVRHRRGDAGGMDERPERTVCARRVGQRDHRGLVGHVAGDTDRSVDLRSTQVGGASVEAICLVAMVAGVLLIGRSRTLADPALGPRVRPDTQPQSRLHL